MRRNLFSVVVLLAIGQTMVGQAVVGAEPKIESFGPCIVSTGETTTLQIVGEGLASLRDLVFYSPEVECVEIVSQDDFEAVVNVRAAEGASVGAVPFRLLTGDGFSNLRTLRITDFPVVNEPERESLNSPTALNPNQNVAIYGTLQQGEFDQYTIELESGETCAAVAEAVRLGGPLLDTVLKVYLPSGELLKVVDDTSLYRQDPALSFTAPQAGRYTIEIHETNYDGGDDSHYVLYLGDFTLPSLVYPAGGQAGESLVVRSTEASGDQSFSIPVPSQLDESWLSVRLGTEGRLSPTAVNLRVAPFGNVLESPANDSVAAVCGSVASVPIALNGILEIPGDVDYFAFEAEEGEHLRFEVFAESIGSPADTRISILDAAETVFSSNDDWGSHDSRLEFKPTTSGVYFLKVTDKLGNGSDMGVYRVEVTRVQPSVTPFLPRPDRLSQAGQSISVARGNRALASIAVHREMFDGDVSVRAEGVSEGIEFPKTTIAADQFWMPVVISADAKTKIGGSLLQLSASSGVDGVTGQFRQTVDLVSGTADTLFYGVTVDRLPLAVMESIPFTLELEQPQSALPSGGTFALKVRVQRAEGFDEPLTVSFPFLPPWVVCEPTLTISAQATEAEHVFNATFEAEERVWPLVAVAEVDVKGSKSDVSGLQGKKASSQLVEIQIAKSPVVGTFAPLATEQGQTLEATCALQFSGSVPADTTAVLEGLPNRVTAKQIQVKGSPRQIRFKLEVPPDAPVGTFDSLQCRLSGQLEGQPISYVVAAGTKLQIAEPGRLARGESGELLSPLEALRQTSKTK